MGANITFQLLYKPVNRLLMFFEIFRTGNMFDTANRSVPKRSLVQTLIDISHPVRLGRQGRWRSARWLNGLMVLYFMKQPSISKEE